MLLGMPHGRLPSLYAPQLANGLKTGVGAMHLTGAAVPGEPSVVQHGSAATEPRAQMI